MRANIGGVEYLDMIDTDGLAIGVYFQGCKRRCKGCHNPTLQTFDNGFEMDVKDIFKPILEHINEYDSIAIMGGEPLEQLDALEELLKISSSYGLKSWLYTGYNYEEVPWHICKLANVIVAGEYIEELRTNGFPASSNQVVSFSSEVIRKKVE
ncbi:MAG: 4Fe-4S cluster-binding domain-containing protein [Bacteroidota bacterium]|nr:4Fe-4S cluster-binding domain-containing protein [Bacteroidota bacterium]